MSKPKTRQDHVRAWKRQLDRGQPKVNPGEPWSVHEVVRVKPRLGHAAMAAARQERLRAYRAATGQEPFDVALSWR